MQQEEFRLTEEEFLLINNNEKIANKVIIQNEQIFKVLLNEYLKTIKLLTSTCICCNIETANSPNRITQCYDRGLRVHFSLQSC